MKFAFPQDLSSSIRNNIYIENYEKSEVEIVKSVIKHDDVVVEAGAALGFVGLNVAEKVGKDRIWMIEANRDLIPIIEANFSLNGYSKPNVIYGMAAAAGRAKDAEFKVSRDFWSSSAIDRGSTVRVDKVPIVDISQLIKDVNASVLICDIEGGEFDLVPEIDLGNVDRLIIELHEALASREKCQRLHSSLLTSGFVLNMGMSRRDVCYFERVNERSQ